MRGVSCVALLFVAVVCGVASASGDVVDVTAKTFKKEVMKNDGVVLVEFYAPVRAT